MHITLIAGARPNFVKIAPVIHAVKKAQAAGDNINYRLVHTGQHYDQRMSETFFKELNIPEPDVNLGCGGGTQAEQTAAIMIAFEKELMAHPTDLVVVVGDVTSTMACSIVAKKLCTKVAHIEAGIRSWDLTMPEEINRMVTDALCDYYFTTSEIANINLRNSGAKEGQIFFVGNVMIDTLMANMHRFSKPAIIDEKNLEAGKYIVLTLHRPGNVDADTKFAKLLTSIADAAAGVPIVFPVHPRTAKIIASLPDEYSASFILTEPMGYLEFNYLVKNSMAVITDSGGITEETTVMRVPCITIRDNTERPETCTIGTNELIGTNPDALKPALDKLFAGQWKKGGIPELWDGHTAERIVSILSEL